MKKGKLFLTTFAMAAALSMTAFAGEWKQDDTGWWYQNDDGSYMKSGWQAIEGKSYYFGDDGYMFHDCVTPDGYSVGSDGAWIDSSVTNHENKVAYTPTLEETNALQSAKNYLNIFAFSYSGLIEQLKYEQYSNSAATYAANNCGADWNEQAAKSALSYLNSSAFSYSGLVDQLKYEGFTDEQAIIAVDRCGANWNIQAARLAQEYINYLSFSRSELIDQLEYEGFTHEQAEYGVSAVGF